MQIYYATFPIRATLTQDDLIQLVIEWNQGSPHNKIKNLTWDGENRNVKFEDGNLYLEIEEIRTYNTIAIRFHQIDANNVIWNTDIVVDFNKYIFAIKLDRETTAESIEFIPKFKTPVIVNMLLEGDYVGTDKGLKITDCPTIVTMENYKLIEAIICQKEVYSMPVVYLTRGYGQDDKIAKELAYKLRGVAHVFWEKDTNVSKVLKETCEGKNAHHGSIGIYYPNNAAPYKFIYANRYKGREDGLINRIVGIVCRYANQQAIPKMMTWEGVQNELLKLRYQSATEKRVRAESEVTEVYNSFDKELEDQKKMIEDLNNRVVALQAENQGLRAKYDQLSEIPLLYYGNEDDLYDGEIKDQLLEVIREQISQTDEKTRKAHILKDIIECNKPTGSLKKKRDDIKRILKGYTKVGDSLKRELKDFGFEIKKDGGHYKLLYNGDARYLFTMSSSGSDSQHGGGNLAAEIKIKLL